MTTTSNNPHDPGLRLPEFISGDSSDPKAQRPPARAREAGTAEDNPASRHVASITTMVPAVLSGSSLWHTQPPSLAMIWDRHRHSARYFEAGLIRGPRYLWGALHVVLAGSAYLVAWVTHSIPLLLATAGVLALVIWLI